MSPVQTVLTLDGSRGSTRPITGHIAEMYGDHDHMDDHTHAHARTRAYTHTTHMGTHTQNTHTHTVAGQMQYIQSLDKVSHYQIRVDTCSCFLSPESKTP